MINETNMVSPKHLVFMLLCATAYQLPTSSSVATSSRSTTRLAVFGISTSITAPPTNDDDTTHTFYPETETIRTTLKRSSAVEDGQTFTFTLHPLPPHIPPPQNTPLPLGVTLEESLNPADPGVTFVRSRVEGGVCELLEVGDVITGASATFSPPSSPTLISVLGVASIKRAVCCRDLLIEGISFRIVKNSGVLERHEEAVERAIDGRLNGATDEDGNQMEGFAEFDVVSFLNEQDDCNIFDDDSECVLAEDDEEGGKVDSSVFIEEGETEGWSVGEGGGGVDGGYEGDEEDPESEYGSAAVVKVPEWSRRSSPSGTWVRDPADGVMKNIDP